MSQNANKNFYWGQRQANKLSILDELEEAILYTRLGSEADPLEQADLSLADTADDLFPGVGQDFAAPNKTVPTRTAEQRANQNRVLPELSPGELRELRTLHRNDPAAFVKKADQVVDRILQRQEDIEATKDQDELSISDSLGALFPGVGEDFATAEEADSLANEGRERSWLDRTILSPLAGSFNRTLANFAAGDAVEGAQKLASVDDKNAYLDDLVERYTLWRNSDFYSDIRGMGITPADIQRLAVLEDGGKTEEALAMREQLASKIDSAVPKIQENLREDISRRLELIQKSNKYPLPISSQDLVNSRSLGEAMENISFEAAPISAGIALMAQSGTETGAALGGAFVGSILGLLGGPKGVFGGASVGGGAATAMVTYNNAVISAAENRGVDTTDVDSFVEAFKDSELAEEIFTEAEKVTAINSAASAAQMGLMTKFVAPLTKSGMSAVGGRGITGVERTLATGRGTILGEAENLLTQTLFQAATDAVAANETSRVVTGEGDIGAAAGAAWANIAASGTNIPQIALMRTGDTLANIRKIDDELSTMLSRIQENSFAENPAFADRVQQSKSAIEQLLSGEIDLSETQTVLNQLANALETGQETVAGVGNILTEVTDQLDLMEADIDPADIYSVDRLSRDAMEDASQDVLTLLEETASMEGPLQASEEILSTAALDAADQMSEGTVTDSIATMDQALTDSADVFGELVESDIANVNTSLEQMERTVQTIGEVAAIEAELGDTAKIITIKDDIINDTIRDFSDDAFSPVVSFEDKTTGVPMNIRLAPRDTNVKKDSGDLLDLVEVGDSARALIETLRSDDVSPAGMRQKLDALHEAYLSGLVYDPILTDSSRHNLEFVSALERGENGRAMEILNETINMPEYKRTLDIQRSDEASVSARLVGYASRDGVVTPTDAQKGEVPVSRSSLSTLEQAMRLVGRGVSAAWKGVRGAVNAQGAINPVERFLRYIKNAHDQAQRTLEFRIRSHQHRTEDLFSRDMSPEQIDVYNEWMHKPTKNNSNKVRQLFGEELGNQMLSAMRERRNIIDSMSRFLINKGLVQGKLHETIQDNINSYLKSQYALTMVGDPLVAVDPAAKNKLISVISEILNGPMLDSSLESAPKSQLVQMMDARGLLDQPVELEGAKAYRSVDRDGNISHTPVKGMSKADLAAILSNEGTMSQQELSAYADNLIYEMSRSENLKIRTRKKSEDTVIGPDRKSFKKATLKNKQDALSLALKDVLQEYVHPDDVFTSTAAGLLASVTQHKMMQSTFNFLLEQGLAHVGEAVPGNYKYIPAPPGMEAMKMVLNIKNKDGTVTRQYINPFHVQGERGAHNGIKVSPEIQESFSKILGSKNNMDHWAWTVFAGANAALKGSYTVANVPAHPRNMISAGLIAMRNGIFPTALGNIANKAAGDADTGPLGIAMQLAWDDAKIEWAMNRTKGPKAEAFIEELIGRGILHDGVRTGTIADFYKDLIAVMRLSKENTTSAKAYDSTRNALEKMYKAHTVPFRLQDEVIKVASFMVERAKWADILFLDDPNALDIRQLLAADPTLSVATLSRQALQEAGIVPTAENFNKAISQLRLINQISADVTLATNPTYSKTSDFVKGLRKFPFIGPFPAFAFESYRTQINAYRYMAMLGRLALTGKYGNLQVGEAGRAAASSWFAQKMTGTLFSELSAQGLKMGSGIILAGSSEWDDTTKMDMLSSILHIRDAEFDRSRALRSMLPDWQRDTTFIVTEHNEVDGTATIFDWSRTHPNGPQMDALGVMSRAMRDYIDGDDTAFDGVFKSSVEAAFGPFISTEPGTEQVFNFFNEIFGGGGGTSVPGMNSYGRDILSSSTALFKAWVPPYINQTNKAIKEKDHNNLAWQAMGVRLYEVNYRELARNNLRAVDRSRREDLNLFLGSRTDKTGPYSVALGDPTKDLSEKEFKELYMGFREREAKMYNWARDSIHGLRVLGENDETIFHLITRGPQGITDSAPINESDAQVLVYQDRLPVRPVFDTADLDSRALRAIEFWTGPDKSSSPEVKEKYRDIIEQRWRWLEELDRNYVLARGDTDVQ